MRVFTVKLTLHVDMHICIQNGFGSVINWLMRFVPLLSRGTVGLGRVLAWMSGRYSLVNKWDTDFSLVPYGPLIESEMQVRPCRQSLYIRV